jgi:PAS domain S-box-containing protein
MAGRLDSSGAFGDTGAGSVVAISRGLDPLSGESTAVGTAVDGQATEPSPPGGVARSAEFVPMVAAALVGAVTTPLLAIWLFSPSLKEFSAFTMKANTAVAMLLSSCSLAILSRAEPSNGAHRSWGRWLAAAVLLLGAATGVEYLAGADFGIDQLLVDDFLSDESRPFPGRMSPIAATCFCLLGMALLVLDVPSSSPRVHLTSVLTLPLVLVSLIAMTGYVYGVHNFYQLGPYIRIAWPTASCFLLLGIGTLMARPHRGPVKYFANARLSGLAARRLLPAVVVIPLAFGWLVVWGQQDGLFGIELGTALFAVSLVVVLGTVVWVDARALESTDREREMSEGLFRSFFNLGLVGMAQTDPTTGRFLRVNSKMEEITGRSWDELAEMTLGDVTHPDERARDRDAFRAMLLGKRSTYSVEKRYIRKDGQIVWVIVNSAAVRMPPGNEVKVVAVIQDITFLKEAQEKLAEALRLREQFLGIASHELKTPLTALLMQIQGVHRLMVADPTLARYASRLERAVAAGLRLERLIHELLDVSRLAEGRLRLEPEPFELGSLVEEIVDRFSEIALPSESPIAVRTEKDIRGSWDRSRIDQVITNLLSNALKYGAGRPIEVVAQMKRGAAVIAVSDHGIGIRKDQQQRIFGRFERSVETRTYGGFGLGLWIAREIVALSGGTIDVESAEGEGACFTVRLPVEQEDAAEPRS